MRQNIFQFLKNYSTDISQINRLLISTFIEINRIKVSKNKIIIGHIIKSNDHDYNSFVQFVNLFDKNFDLENLIELFEFVISPIDKIINGAVYTPPKIRSYIINNTISKLDLRDDIRIADISCGCGGFLVDAAIFLKKNTDKGFYKIFKDNIFGLDIKEYSIERTKLIFSLIALYFDEDQEDFHFNLFVGNALNYEWPVNFDIILGNPPYVCSRNIELESRQYLGNWNVCSTGHPDLYIPFFEIAMTILKSNGVLGFISMNTFFKSVNGRGLREYFQNQRFEFSLLDFGSQQVFRSKSTYTCICIIRKTKSETLRYFKLTSLESLLQANILYTSILYNSLDSFQGWNLQEISIINKIESIGIPLGKLFKSRNGIATLKNGVYIFKPNREDEYFYYIKDFNEFPIEKQICKDIINPNKLTRIDVLEPIKRKVIFPYEYKNGKVSLIPEKFFRKLYPRAYQYLVAHKDMLKERDKGNGNYESWFAYGRNQSLEKLKYKLFFPHIAPAIPNYVINSDENLLFHNGLAIVGRNERELQFLKKIMSSRLFWFYIKNSSKPYGSGYYSLSRNYIKNFGIYEFTELEIDYIIKEQDYGTLNEFIERKYNVVINE